MLRRSTAPGPRSRRIRITAAILLIAAMTVLAGCTPIASFIRTASTTGSSSATGSFEAPAVGACWRSTYSDALADFDWNGGSPIACTGTHQLYTYAVVAVRSAAKTWATDSGSIDHTISQDADDACQTKLVAFLPVLPPHPRLIQIYFVPSEAQWKKGARWVRCDLSVLKIGSSATDPSFAALPAAISTLVDQVKNTRDLFADCVSTSDPSGATGPHDDPDATIADCTHVYQWRLQNYFDMGLSDVYPTDDAKAAIEQARCGNQAPSPHDWTTYVPTEEEWSTGDHTGECWFYNENLPQS